MKTTVRMARRAPAVLVLPPVKYGTAMPFRMLSFVSYSSRVKMTRSFVPYTTRATCNHVIVFWWSQGPL